MLKNKKFLIFGGSVMVVLVLYFVLRSTGTVVSADVIVPVETGEFVVDVNTSGELQAKNSTNIMGPSGMRNYRLYQVNIQDIVDEGTYVSKGDYVARLDPSDLTSRVKDTQLEVDREESQYVQTQLDTTLQMRQARDELINLKYAVEEKDLILEQSKFEPPATIKQAEINVDKAKRALKQAQENYLIKRKQSIAKMQEVAANRNKKRLELEGLMTLQQSFTIFAPEDGMVIYKKNWDGTALKEGGQVSAWDPVVATLPDLSSMNSLTYVNEVDIRRISVGQKVDIGLDAFPDKKLTGIVKRVANVGEQRPNSDAKVFQVTIELNKIDDSLRPGMTTSNKIYTSIIPEALFIPLECLHNYADSITYVYLKDGLGYTKQEISIGQTNANSAEVLLGLEEGNQLYLSIPDENGVDIKLLPELNGKRNKAEQEPQPKQEQQDRRKPGFGKKRPNAQ